MERQEGSTGQMEQSRIQALRMQMQAEEIDFYLIPTTDFHNSEYVGEYFKVREFFSGFTGSNGSLLVWQKGAGLWTDGRYFIQAKRELAGTDIRLFQMQEEGVPSILEFLERNMKAGQTLGFDGRVVPAEYGNRLKRGLSEKGVGIKSGKDLAEAVWKQRPALPDNPAFFLNDGLVGETSNEKLIWLRTAMEEARAGAVLLSRLDEIMWLFNLRGKDVACNPVALSYAYVTPVKTLLFLQKAAAEGKEAVFKRQGIEVREYGQVFSVLEEEFETAQREGKQILIDSRNSSFAMYRLLEEVGVRILDTESPVGARKAVKNEIELEQMRKIYLKDSVAVTKFIYWLKHQPLDTGLTELDAAEYIDALRKEIPEFLDFSFPTISAYKENAAMMHYEATKACHSVLKKEGMLLVDSGGQYLGGTTDVTRTVVLGTITEEIKKQYSAVAAGMLSLANAVFLKGCTGRNLDILAREPLWKHYRDYKCGTGHGVGYILNVHEGPHNIRWKYIPEMAETVLREGMAVTDEPGIYIEGSHGIRIENVLAVKQVCKNTDGTFLAFENLTFVPLDKAAVKREYMNDAQWEAFFSYQQEVYKKLAPYLTEAEARWLKEETQGI